MITMLVLTYKALQANIVGYVPERVPKEQGYWKDKRNQKAFFDQLAVKLNIQKLEDWNNVAPSTVFKEGGHFIHLHYNSSVRQGKSRT
jgi:hypothetical protein